VSRQQYRFLERVDAVLRLFADCLLL